MLLDGYVKSKNNTPIAGAKIEIKNNSLLLSTVQIVTRMDTINSIFPGGSILF